MADICPNCNSDLTGEPIPERYFLHNTADNPEWDRKHHTPCEEQVAEWGRCYCLPYGDKAPEDRFFSRQIGIEIQEIYDGVLFWACPDCGHAWHRWTMPDMMAKAQSYIDRHNKDKDHE